MIIREKKKTTLALLLVLMLTLISFAGCGNSDNGNNNSSEDPSKTSESAVENDRPAGDLAVTISIDFPDDSDMKDVKDADLAVPADATVLDLLFAYVNDNGLEIDTEGEDDSYVSKIGTVQEDDTSGWVFTINGETVMESATKSTLNSGDHVEWKYTTWQE